MMDIIEVDDYNGGKVDILIDASIGSCGPTLLNFKKYRPRACEVLMPKLYDKSGLFIDVGAHFGYFSVLASHWMFSGVVLSFEPNPYGFKMLKRNVNNTNSGVRTFPIDKVASSTGGRYSAIYNRIDREGTTFHPDNSGQFLACSVYSQVRNIMTMEKSYGMLAVKIHTNGSEVDVLIGMNRILDQTDCIIVSHDVSKKGFAPYNEMEILKSRGFTFRDLDGKNILMERNVQ